MKHTSKEPQAQASDFLSTGSTLLNLACAGRVFGGLRKGHYYFLVGDSDSGKTFLSLTCLAEAAINPAFDEYRFIFDDAEDGALMDKSRFFGRKMQKRLEPPGGTKADPVFSDSVESFYYHLDDAVKDGRPFIYILDSQDALSSKAEGETFAKQKSAYRKGGKAKGSYGDSKAKAHSSTLRRFIHHLRKTGSIIIVIGQAKASFDLFEDQTHSGGRSLKFYATLQAWSAQRGILRKELTNGKKIQQGIIARVRVRKNRMLGRDRTVDMPIYHSYGIDDLESCVDYLVDWGHWKKRKGGLVDASELDLLAKKEDLIAAIEEKGKERALRRVVGKVWKEIEKKAEVNRKRRYV